MKLQSKLIAWLSIGLLSINMAFAAPQDAVAQVKENATQVLSILNKANSKNNDVVRQEAENYAVPYFDFERMTRTAIGQPWTQATNEQKQMLVKEVKTLLIRTYSQQMLNFKDSKVTVHDNPVVRNGGKNIDVKVTVQPAGKQPIEMVFNTYPKDDKYLVYNVVIEGAINLVIAQNKQFTPILQSKGIDGLIADLKAKNNSQ